LSLTPRHPLASPVPPSASPAVAPVTPTLKPTPASTLDVFTGDPNFMTSLARGLIVIQAFTQQNPQMTISQLSVRTGLSRAAVRRCLYTLTKLGFAGAEDGSRYSLRPRMLTLSHTYTTSNTLSSAAQPILERMSSALRESFSVATLDGDDIVYVARTTVNRVMAVDLHIGSRLPAYCTSMGRILLAYLPSDQLEQYLARIVLTPHTTRTVNSIEKSVATATPFAIRSTKSGSAPSPYPSSHPLAVPSLPSTSAAAPRACPSSRCRPASSTTSATQPPS
jgi:IclR family transcriptional regulator, pca regulon regulatory protein